MDVHVPLFSLIILTSLASLGAGYAWRAFRQGSASTRRGKLQPSPDQTPTSDAALARIAADQAELFSTLEKLTTTVKRLSSRKGMQELREERAQPEAPPKGAAKADLYRHYGFAGLTARQIAQKQLDLEASNHERTN